MAPGYQEFEFDLPEALLGRLVEILGSMEPAPLAAESLLNIPDAQGVYQLYLDTDLVYIGKTDAAAGLRRRLQRHIQKIQHREGLDPTRVLFKAVRVFVFTAMDLETQLISSYGGVANLPWNGSGFGSNDPGKNRDTTVFKENHYDFQFPINIDIPLGLTLPTATSASEILQEVKKTLPYVLRFQTKRPKSQKPHRDLVAAEVQGAIAKNNTAREIVELVVNNLPPGWQATKLPSHLILYQNDSRKLPQGTVIATSPVQ